MKELSIKEKAKAYDEVIEKFDVILNLNTVKESGTIFADDVRKIFPELKESEKSEDEKIRKAISDILLMDSDEIREILDANNFLMQDILAWLEKQCEKESVTCPICGWKIEKQGEQKPVDKVEPNFNFNVGQWIVATGKCVYLITKIDGFNVTLVDVDGNEYVFDTSSLENAHLWTIQDAKDGDVLIPVDNKYPFIYKGCLDPDHPNSPVGYCGIDLFGKFLIGGKKLDNWWTDKEVKPATKEQRDLLFQKMQEAGYVWDSEKKELKKIEQKPANKVEPFDKYEGLTDFERTIADICIGWIGQELGWKQYIKDNADVLLKIAVKKFNSVQDASFEQKPAWSGENEKMTRALMSICDEWATRHSYLPQKDNDIEKIKRWLKSLKDKVQPKQEQSEEDEHWRQKAIDFMKHPDLIKATPTLAKDTIDWLKSLRPQNHWKPSDEQMNALDSTLQYSKVSHNSYEHLNLLYNDLKKLKE